jgi:hypothetical protein
LLIRQWFKWWSFPFGNQIAQGSKSPPVDSGTNLRFKDLNSFRGWQRFTIGPGCSHRFILIGDYQQTGCRGQFVFAQMAVIALTIQAFMVGAGYVC